MSHKFRMIDGIDYVKLPCIRRGLEGEIGVKRLSLNLDNTLRLRRELILSTVVNFEPDILLVGKNEVVSLTNWRKACRPLGALVLKPRWHCSEGTFYDAATTIDQWRRQRA